MFNSQFFFTLLTFIILLIHPPIAVAGTLTLVVRGNDYFDFDKSHGRYGEHRPNPRVSALLWSLKQVGIRTILVSPLLEGFTVYGGNKTLTKKIYSNESPLAIKNPDEHDSKVNVANLSLNDIFDEVYFVEPTGFSDFLNKKKTSLILESDTFSSNLNALQNHHYGRDFGRIEIDEIKNRLNQEHRFDRIGPNLQSDRAWFEPYFEGLSVPEILFHPLARYFFSSSCSCFQTLNAEALVSHPEYELLFFKSGWRKEDSDYKNLPEMKIHLPSIQAYQKQYFYREEFLETDWDPWMNTYRTKMPEDLIESLDRLEELYKPVWGRPAVLRLAWHIGNLIRVSQAVQDNVSAADALEKLLSIESTGGSKSRESLRVEMTQKSVRVGLIHLEDVLPRIVLPERIFEHKRAQDYENLRDPSGCENALRR